jgi:3',5'-cyclic-AMP phosphodiesterase
VPGTAPSPGPVKNVPPGKLKSLLGVTNVRQVSGNVHLAIVDTPLQA